MTLPHASYDLHLHTYWSYDAPADGIECVNSTPPELAAFYRQYCLKHKMLSSAGSDSHTCPLDNPDANGMAKFTADDRWLDELLERVRLY